MRKAIQKAIQSHLLSFLTHRWALPFLVILVFLTLNSVLLFLAAFLRPSSAGIYSSFDTESGLGRMASSSAKWYDNIAGVSYEDQLCSDSVDIVYTWVNGTDPRQIEALEACKLAFLQAANLTHLRKCNSSENPVDHHCVKDDATLNRYIDNEELRYSLRSVEKYAPWIRNIYIVTNGQIPSWLNLQRPRLYIISHSQIYQNKSHLPVFSSPSIESQLHNIPGLSRKWIYLNDDVMFGNYIWPSDFYTEARGQKIFLSWPVPNCADNCPANWIGDGFCDIACNTTECDLDGGDCANTTATGSTNPWWWSPTSTSGSKDYNDIYCSKGCPDSWIGDKYCDRSCRQPDCAMDGGDCGPSTVYESIKGYILSDSLTVQIPQNVYSTYLNLSNIIPLFDEIITASHDNNKLIRSAAILQKPKVLIFSFFRKHNEGIQNISVEIEVHAAQNITGNFTAEQQQLLASPRQDYNVTLILYLDTGSKIVNNGTSLNGTTTNSTVGRNETQPTPSILLKRSLLEDEGPGDEHNEEELDTEILTSDTNSTILSTDLSLNSTNTTITSNNTNTNQTQPTPQSSVPTPYSAPKPPKKSMDYYGESLKFVNRLMTDKFGPESRRVPAHMPHFLDNNIMKELMAAWPEEFDATSSHKLRSPHDMQYAFAYYYFLMNDRVPYDFDNVFDNILDNNRDGVLDLNEIRTLSLILYGTVMEQRDYYIFRENVFVNCSLSTLQPPPSGFNSRYTHPNPYSSSPSYTRTPTGFNRQQIVLTPVSTTNSNITTNLTASSNLSLSNANETLISGNISLSTNTSINSTQAAPKRLYTPDSEFPPITKEYLQNCEAAKKKIEGYYSNIRKHKFEIMDTDEVAFIMVGTNSTDVLRAIDGIRIKKQKFICLNDNMNHSDPRSLSVIKVLQEFYSSIVPSPSSFELPPNKTNRYLYIDDFVKAKEEIQVRKRAIYILIGIVCLCFLSLAKSCISSDNRPIKLAQL